MKIPKRILILFLIVLVSPLLVDARSGCCSHHKGVCGCKCCDGTALSQQCLPYYSACKKTNLSKYIIKKSNSVCYEKGTLLYNQIKSYIPYNSMNDCLNSGGKSPKRKK